MEQRPLGLAPRDSHPGRQDLHGARHGGGRASSTRPELHARHPHRTSFPRAHSQCATSCRTTSLDMSRFPAPQALVSWAGLTPAARQSGHLRGRGNVHAKRIAVLAVYAAANTDTFLGERFRRLASRPGGGGRKKAGCAVSPLPGRPLRAAGQRSGARRCTPSPAANVESTRQGTRCLQRYLRYICALTSRYASWPSQPEQGRTQRDSDGRRGGYGRPADRATWPRCSAGRRQDGRMANDTELGIPSGHGAHGAWRE